MPQKEPSMQDLLQIAGSPAGQKLLQHLQAQNSRELKEVANSAAAGNLAQAKTALLQLMKDPEIKKLFDQLGGSNE